VSDPFSSDLEQGFLVANLLLVGFGLVCWRWPVRRGWAAGLPLGWAWVLIESVNAIGHPLWTLRQGRYTPGVVTAPLLGLLAWRLAGRLIRPRAQAVGA